MSADTELDSRLSCRSDWFFSRQAQIISAIGSVTSQLAAESDSTCSLFLRAAKSCSHFSLDMFLTLLRFISINSVLLSAAALITSSRLVLLGASVGNALSLVAVQ